MSKKRSDIEITVDILKMAVPGVRKSHIVYKANLNFKIADKYLDLLMKSELISGPQEDRTYKTTEKGLRYIDRFEDLLKYVKCMEKPN